MHYLFEPGLLSSGPVKDLNWAQRSILFVNGDIDDCNRLTECVIFCDGKPAIEVLEVLAPVS